MHYIFLLVSKSINYEHKLVIWPHQINPDLNIYDCYFLGRTHSARREMEFTLDGKIPLINALMSIKEILDGKEAKGDSLDDQEAGQDQQASATQGQRATANSPGTDTQGSAATSERDRGGLTLKQINLEIAWKEDALSKLDIPYKRILEDDLRQLHKDRIRAQEELYREVARDTHCGYSIALKALEKCNWDKDAAIELIWEEKRR